MNRTITFNELRKIKDSLPSGSMHRIADELNMSVETVRNFFGGHNFKTRKCKKHKIEIPVEWQHSIGIFCFKDVYIENSKKELLWKIN